MRQGALNGWGKVFRFTLSRTVSGKGWKLLTLIPALLLLVCIPVIFLLAHGEGEEELTSTSLRVVYVADETPGDLDFSLLNQLGDPLYSDLRYVYCASPEDALSRAAREPDSLVLSLTREEEYRLQVVLPETCILSMQEAEGYAGFLNESFGSILPLKSGLTPKQLVELMLPVYFSAVDAEALLSGEESDPDAEVKEVVGTFLPYLNVMVLYFLVLFYGQNVASGIVLEKQSKLMDTFLLSLRPEAMVLGKLLAGALAGILQAFSWIVGAAAGLFLGVKILMLQNPAAESGVLRLLGALGSNGLFAPLPSLLAVLLIVGGFLLYCSVAAIGGALAGKQADLSSTNTLFTTLLVASFLITILGKTGGSGQLISDASWMNYVPFTAVLTLPSRLVLGEAEVLTGLVSLALVLAFALVVAILAGRLYALLAFRKGNPPKVQDIPKLLKNK